MLSHFTTGGTDSAERSTAMSHARFLMFEVQERAEQMAAAGGDVIDLTLGRSDLMPRPAILEAMTAALWDPVVSNLVHPMGLPRLRSALATLWTARSGQPITPDHVLVSCGTSTLFRNLFACLTRPGERIVMPRPYYPLYLETAKLAHLEVGYYDIDLETGSIREETLEAALREPARIVIVNSPGNPLGNVLDTDSLARVDCLVGGRATIISDEIYGDQVFNGPITTALSLADRQSPLIVTSSFSKGYRMYARRVGYCIAEPGFLRDVGAVQDHTLLTTDPVPQMGAVAALEYPEDCEAVRDLHRSRCAMALEILRTTPDVTTLPPRGGFYLTIDARRYLKATGRGSSHELAVAILNSLGVATVPGSDFGLPTMLRLSFTSARFPEGIRRLDDFFRRRL